MPYKYTVNQETCARCGSCEANCPYGIITRRKNEYRVTAFCSGCGNCTGYCPTGAIAKSEVELELDSAKVSDSLRELLGVKKQLVAMKYPAKQPENIKVEEGPQFWCAMCGDVFFWRC